MTSFTQAQADLGFESGGYQRDLTPLDGTGLEAGVSGGYGSRQLDLESNKADITVGSVVTVPTGGFNRKRLNLELTDGSSFSPDVVVSLGPLGTAKVVGEGDTTVSLYLVPKQEYSLRAVVKPEGIDAKVVYESFGTVVATPESETVQFVPAEISAGGDSGVSILRGQVG